MDRQARTGDTVLVKSREMTGRTQTLQKTKNIGPFGVGRIPIPFWDMRKTFQLYAVLYKSDLAPILSLYYSRQSLYLKHRKRKVKH
jgi:hypothetical protein